MSIHPEGDKIRNAVKWIGQEKKANPQKSKAALIAEAGIRFNLSPLEMEFLTRQLSECQPS